MKKKSADGKVNKVKRSAVKALKGKKIITKVSSEVKKNNGSLFPKANMFWLRRSKHGREKLFTTPELLWEAACDYFKSNIDNPNYETQVKGPLNELVYIPHISPFTWEGLCLYCNCDRSYFRAFKSTHKDRPESADYITIILNIEQVIYSQQFDGASTGMYNANIIARYLGLVDKQDVTTKGERVQVPEIKVYTTPVPMSSSEKELDTQTPTLEIEKDEN